MIDFFFFHFVVQQSFFRLVHRSFFLVLVIFHHSVSFLVELILLLHYLFCSLSCIPFYLSYPFTLHFLQQRCDWRTLSTSGPISSLFIDFTILSHSSPPPARPPNHSVPSLLPLLFTSLFHTFCLAFKSSFYISDWLAYRKKVDMASQAKGLVSFLEPVTVHHSPIVITAETSSSGKFQRWWTHHYWQSRCLYLA